MSQEALAVDARLETVYVSRIERGIANPTVRVLERIARALRVDASELLKIETARVASPNLRQGRKAAPARRGVRAKIVRTP